MTDPKWWDLTIPRDDNPNIEILISALDEMAERYVIGEEIGDGGYKHWQIRAVMKVPKVMATVRNQLEKYNIWGTWATPTSDNGRNFNYTEKEGKFFRSWEKALRSFATLELREWQAQIEELIKHQNERQCMVIYDPAGNHGKTYFSKYMQATHQAQYVPPMGDAMDLMAFAMEKPYKAYIFDMPRSESVKQKKGMWSAIEQIKNGYLYDKRYKFRDAWITPPKVLVFCNEVPDLDALSADRWQLLTLSDTPMGTLVLPYDEVYA